MLKTLAGFSQYWNKIVDKQYIIWIILYLTTGLLLITLLSSQLREGIDDDHTYSEYDLSDPNNAIILAQKNAGNIQSIKDMIGNITELREMVDDNTTGIKEVQTQVNDLAEAQNSMAGEMVGTEVPEISD